MHLMIDFETLDTRPNAAALSVGLVLFNQNGIVATKYFKLCVDDQLDAGRTVSAKTIAWWANQSEAAREALNPQITDLCPNSFNYLLFHWLERNEAYSETLQVWGNGANFDLPLLDSLTEGWGSVYEFRNARCFREFSRNGCKALVTRKGIHHNALDDAIFQTECVLAQWAKERGTK